MLGNCSMCISLETQRNNFFQYCLYVIQGFCLALTNLVIFVAILRQPLVRVKKEFIIVSALSFVNGINGLATLLGGVGRNILILKDTANVLISRWSCFFAPWNLIWQLSFSLVPVMLLIVSIDRLIAVALALRYYKQDWHYAITLVSTGFLYSLGQVCVGAFLTHQHSSSNPQDLVPQTCMMGWSTSPPYHAYLTKQRLVCSGLSVLLYVFVIYFYRAHRNRMARSRREQREQLTQCAITKTLGVSALVTLFCFFLPLVVELMTVVVFRLPPDGYTQIGAYIQLVTNMDAVLDFFLFTMRHREVRLAVEYLFKCQTLTMAKLRDTKGQKRQMVEGSELTTTNVMLRPKTRKQDVINNNSI